jgi:LacI family transcriptional regulator
MIKKIRSKTVTVIDVAKHAGVSKSTVSLVLTNSHKVSDKSKIKVLKSIDMLGYIYNRDAAMLRSKKSNLIAIVINDLTNPYSAQLAVFLERHIEDMGFFSILVNSGESIEKQRRLVNKLKEYKAAAFVICPAPTTEAQWVNNLVLDGFPVVHIMREIDGAFVPTVLPDNVKGAYIATNHLIDKGFKRIAFLGGKEKISDYHERLSGFSLAMNEADLPHPTELKIQKETNRHGGRQAIVQALETDPNLEAVVCFNDVIAYGVIDKLRSLGKTPGEDIAIVGFDDLADSKLMSPPLSTVHISADQIGKTVCKVLYKIMNNEKTKPRELVDVTFMDRESV